jgi:hypothetical protein
LDNVLSKVVIEEEFFLKKNNLIEGKINMKLSYIVEKTQNINNNQNYNNNFSNAFTTYPDANEINNNTYNYNYPIVIWEDNDNGKIVYDADGAGLYHIRAFYYCKKNIYISINRSG